MKIAIIGARGGKSSVAAKVLIDGIVKGETVTVTHEMPEKAKLPLLEIERAFELIDRTYEVPVIKENYEDRFRKDRFKYAKHKKK